MRTEVVLVVRWWLSDTDGDGLRTVVGDTDATTLAVAGVPVSDP